jgi:tRNA U34 5-carboxymethylaminomethyl modifying enzyme MnmG/GidA
MASTPNFQGKIATLTAHKQQMTDHIVQLNGRIRVLDEKIHELGSKMREAQSKANAASVAHYRQMAQFAIQQRNQLVGYVRQNMSMVRKYTLYIQRLQQSQQQQQPAKTRGGKKANRKTRKN